MFKDIYFINSAELAKRLSSKDVSDYMALRHFIAFLIIFNSAYIFPVLTVPAGQNEWISLSATFITMAVINYYGLTWLFQINSKGDGVEFFKRFCCLSLSVSVKATIVFVFVFIVLIALITRFIADEGDNSVAIDFAMYFLEIGYLIYFYKLMGQSIRASSNYTSENGDRCI